MKVRMLVSRSGTDGAFAPGDVIDVPADEGQRMIAAEQAEIVRGARKETTAALPAAGVETTADATAADPAAVADPVETTVDASAP